MTSSPMAIAIVHGPNLNMLGLREPEIYGSASLEDINVNLQKAVQDLPCSLSFFQSNGEGALIDHIQGLRGKAAGLVANLGAFTHTSIGLRDAIAAAEVPTIEVHISNTYAREEFRHKSYVSGVARGVICGLGPYGYEAAVRALIKGQDTI